MIVVNRGKEPNSLLEFRKQNPNADYEMDIPSNVLKDIRQQLWNEQVHLCGYCMRKITSPSVVRVEHCKPRHPKGEIEYNAQATLDYKWMLGVCYGNSLVRGVRPQDKTCDAHRANQELTINPYDVQSVRKLKYRADGTIYSEDVEINKDVTETLNLNCQAVSLPQSRNKKKAYHQCDMPRFVSIQSYKSNNLSMAGAISG